MIRQKLIKKNESGFKTDIVEWRCHEVLRIEAFSDAVFAFSITLLIVSLEVPETFDELMNAMKGFFSFAICFTLLFQIWYAQFKYFRRYGLQDFYPTILNGLLLFVVLFYMYPLKFLFNLLLPGAKHNIPEGEVLITQEQVPDLMIIYGAGFIAVHLIFILLYDYALKCKDKLGLNHTEIFETNTKKYVYIVLLLIGISSVLFAYFSDPSYAGIAGMLYFLIGPVLTVFYRIRKKKFIKKFGITNENSKQ